MDLLEKVARLLGLRWSESCPAPPAPGDEPERGTSLPADLATRLREVLAQGDLDEFRRQIAAVRQTHPESEARWRALDEAAATFELSRLRQLLD
jgi:hypothetical protein